MNTTDTYVNQILSDAHDLLQTGWAHDEAKARQLITNLINDRLGED